METLERPRSFNPPHDDVFIVTASDDYYKYEVYRRVSACRCALIARAPDPEVAVVFLTDANSAIELERAVGEVFTPRKTRSNEELPEPLSTVKLGPEPDKLGKTVQSGPKSQHEASELPDHLTRVPGLVGQLTDWIADSARKPHRAGALLATLELIGTAAGRKYSGPTLTGTHLYGLFLAPSGASKDHPLKCIGRVLHACTMGQHFGPSGFMSLSAVISRMNRQPLTLATIDEFGSFLARINGRKCSPHEKAITGLLRTAWGSSFDTMPMPEWAGKVGEPVHAPALSIYGVSTHEEFFQSLDGGDVFNGFLNRFLIFSTHQRVSEREPKASKLVVPEPIIEAMVAIYEADNKLAAATSQNGRSDGPEKSRAVGGQVRARGLRGVRGDLRAHGA